MLRLVPIVISLRTLMTAIGEIGLNATLAVVDDAADVLWSILALAAKIDSTRCALMKSELVNFS
jgi:hypothetical protein